jgi:hypothetical protein
MAKMIRKKAENDPEELKQAIIKADVWVLITATKDSKGTGAEISIRESYHTGAINVIAMLLEHEEIYEAVQAKIAQVKMMEKKRGDNSQNLNVN